MTPGAGFCASSRPRLPGQDRRRRHFRSVALSRKRVLNPRKNNPRDSQGRIAGCFRRHGNDLQNLRRASAYRAHRCAAGGMRGEPGAGVLVALGGRVCRVRMVPVERIELPTFGLQNRCSTAELNRRIEGALWPAKSRLDSAEVSAGRISDLPAKGQNPGDRFRLPICGRPSSPDFELAPPARHQIGPRRAHRGSQNSFTAAATPLLMMSRRSAESILSSSSRLTIEPASSRTAGIRVDFSTMSLS